MDGILTVDDRFNIVGSIPPPPVFLAMNHATDWSKLRHCNSHAASQCPHWARSEFGQHFDSSTNGYGVLKTFTSRSTQRRRFHRSLDLGLNMGGLLHCYFSATLNGKSPKKAQYHNQLSQLSAALQSHGRTQSTSPESCTRFVSFALRMDLSLLACDQSMSERSRLNREAWINSC